MSEANPPNAEVSHLPVEPPTSPILAIVALTLPVLAGVWLCFVTSFPLAIGISVATVITTAAFVAMDAHRLGKVDLNGKVRESAGLLFIGMCVMWIAIYPLAFFRRRSFGGPNLGFLSVVVAALFVGVPLLHSQLIPPSLPACSSPEAIHLLDQLIRSMPVGAHLISMDGHREIRFDEATQVRHGECMAHTDAGDLPVKFFIEWQDGNRALFQVRIPPADLPSCNDPGVVKVLDQVIRSTLVGAKLLSIDAHREIRFDNDASVRYCQCVAHTDAGDIPVEFIVEWQDRDKGLFQVRTVDTGSRKM